MNFNHPFVQLFLVVVMPIPAGEYRPCRFPISLGIRLWTLSRLHSRQYALSTWREVVNQFFRDLYSNPKSVGGSEWPQSLTQQQTNSASDLGLLYVGLLQYVSNKAEKCRRTSSQSGLKSFMASTIWDLVESSKYFLSTSISRYSLMLFSQCLTSFSMDLDELNNYRQSV
jgi:hypothetical protein